MIFGVTIILNIKVMMIEKKHYQLINIVIDQTIFKRYQNNLKISDTWKIQLTIANKFIPSTDNEEEPVMH